MGMHSEFLDAIREQRRVTVRFRSTEDQGDLLVRECAPMDYGPSRIDNYASDRYHFWDYFSGSGPHPLILETSAVVSIDALPSGFDPGEFVTWRTNWKTPRNWGPYS